jgi:hypothetical protein
MSIRHRHRAHPPSHPPTHIHKTVCSPELVPGCDLETSTRLSSKELFCAVILSNAIRISRDRISDRRSPSPIPPATRASVPEARRHRFCPGRLLHFGPDLVGHCAPPGSPRGHTSNRSALPELPSAIIRTASTRSVAASHVTHTAVLRCFEHHYPHPLPLLVNPLTTFLFDKVCVLVTPTCGFYCFNL